MNGQELTGLPLALTKFLVDKLAITTLVETGTGLGRTAKIASSIFETVHTIEANYERWLFNAKQFKNTNVNCVYGKSPGALKETLRKIDTTAIVFLDAHCSYRKPIDDNPCPLLAEIAVIPKQHIVIIDDEHSFTKPHKVEAVVNQWPELIDVLLVLYACDNPYVFIDSKSIIAVPRKLKGLIQKFYLQQTGDKK